MIENGFGGAGFKFVKDKNFWSLIFLDRYETEN